MWGVIFDLWTLCGVLCGVFCECGGISRGILCVGALCGVIPLLAVWGVFLGLEAVCVFFYVCGVVWGRVCEWGFRGADYLCGVFCVCGVIFWCVRCVGSCVWGILPRVSYRVPGCGGKVSLSGSYVFFFSPTFFGIFTFDLLLNHVSPPILPLF